MGGCGGFTLYATEDGGATWERRQRSDGQPFWWWPAPRSGPPTAGGAGFLGAPRFVDRNEGWIAIGTGAGVATGGVLHTTDGGRTWTRSNGDSLWTNVVVAPTDGALWAAVTRLNDAHAPAIYRTLDGFHWERVLESKF